SPPSAIGTERISSVPARCSPSSSAAIPRARWSATCAAVREPLNLSGAMTTVVMTLVKQSQRGGRVVGRDRQCLELIDARELGRGHRDIRDALEDHLDHDRYPELGGHGL